MADPLRVMLVADAVGGVWDYALALAGGLLRSESVRVLLMVVGPPPTGEQRAAAGVMPGLEVRVLGGRLDWMEGGHDSLHALRRGVVALAAQWCRHPTLRARRRWSATSRSWPAGSGTRQRTWR